MSKKDDAPARRCFLYHSSCLTGQIFTGDEAIAAAEDDGWTDAPGDVTEAANETGDPGVSADQLAEYDALRKEHADAIDDLVKTKAELEQQEAANAKQATEIRSLKSQLAAAKKKAG